MKKASGLKKKQFIILIVSVCAVALIAEGILLAHTFSAGKEKDKHKPTPTPTKEPFSNGTWVPVSHKWMRDGGEVLHMERFEYDDEGRLISVKMYSGGGELYCERIVTYDQNGARTEEWDIGEERKLHSVSLCGITINYRIGESYDCRYDNDGLITQITKYREEDGVKTAVEEKRFLYYPDGRIRKVTACSSEIPGEWTHEKETEYRYEGDNTITMCGSTEMVFRGNRMISEVYYADDSRTRVSARWTRHNVFPQQMEYCRDFYNIGNWMDDYDAYDIEQALGADRELIYLRKTEFDTDGRPILINECFNGSTGDPEALREYFYDEQGRLIRIQGKEVLSAFSDRAPDDTESLINYDEDGNPFLICNDSGTHRLEWKLIPVK